MKKEIVKINPKEYGLEKKSGDSIEKAFTPKIIERDGLAVIYKQLITKEITKELCDEAGDLRRKLVKVRTGIDKIHKTQKAYYLNAGRLVDAWKNKETLPVTQMEEKLMEVEKYHENLEKERQEKLQKERKELISKYVEDVEGLVLFAMDDEVWDAYYSTMKKRYEDRIAAEKKAEEDRIAKEKAEKEKQRKTEAENKRLKEEARKKEEKRKADEKKRKEKEAKEKAKRDEKERKQKEKHEAQLKKEKDAQEKLKKELEEKEAKEKQRQKEAKEKADKELKEAEDRYQEELNKGDKDKFKDLLKDLEDIKTGYKFKSDNNIKMFEEVSEKINRIIQLVEFKNNDFE